MIWAVTIALLSMAQATAQNLRRTRLKLDPLRKNQQAAHMAQAIDRSTSLTWALLPLLFVGMLLFTVLAERLNLPGGRIAGLAGILWMFGRYMEEKPDGQKSSTSRKGRIISILSIAGLFFGVAFCLVAEAFQ